jgi:ABC-type lipoprotein release transport system permease subunit
LSKVTGLSLPQITLLIRQYRQDGEVRVRPGRRRCFAVKYTQQDAHVWMLVVPGITVVVLAFLAALPTAIRAASIDPATTVRAE